MGSCVGIEWKGRERAIRAIWMRDGEATVRERRMCARVSSENVCAVGIVWQMLQGDGGQGSDCWDDARALGGGLHELEQCGRKVDGMQRCCRKREGGGAEDVRRVFSEEWAEFFKGEKKKGKEREFWFFVVLLTLTLLLGK